ncbi:hypothetical protein K435DRAFT_934131 [Dendrothele bispora CBS 962.96]|uniref:Uncharacterized protein n=1 Tax=Dendrothele bispora (strain CBS 962.96) TaxID=1314807 RepID=A0A4S8L1K2_DENBC|nr:hypothetical protein K435DRAFT_934131 [Dendrothele bispora CBS 962.96]
MVTRGEAKKVARKVDPIVDNGANEELSNERVPKESQLTEFYDHWSQVLRVLQGTQIFIDHCYSFGADTGQALRLIERRAVERNLRSLEDAYYGLLWIGPVNELSSRYTAQDKRVINRNVEHVETYHEHKVDSNSWPWMTSALIAYIVYLSVPQPDGKMNSLFFDETLWVGIQMFMKEGKWYCQAG